LDAGEVTTSDVNESFQKEYGVIPEAVHFKEKLILIERVPYGMT
jgi:hypothetical protein